MAKVEIAGKEYELKFFLSDKREIEAKLGKYLHHAMWSGLSEDLNVTVAVGLRHGSTNRRITPLAVEELLQKHIDKGGDLMDVHKAVNRAIFDSQILGRNDPAEIDRKFREYFGPEVPKEQGAAGG